MKSVWRWICVGEGNKCTPDFDDRRVLGRSSMSVAATAGGPSWYILPCLCVCVCCNGVWENTCSGTAVATGISGKIMETESHCANSNLTPHIFLPSVSPSLSFFIIDKTSGENTVHLVELWFRCACYLLSRSNPPSPPNLSKSLRELADSQIGSLINTPFH